VARSFGLVEQPNVAFIPGGAFLSVQVPLEADLPVDGALVALVRPDADGDGVSNADEAQAGTDPFSSNVADPAAQMGDSCPGAATSLDAVAFGPSVRGGCGGGEAAPLPGPGESLQRRALGCIDQGDNAGDFDPAPVSEARQPVGEAATCYCTGDTTPDVTGTGAQAALEVEFCNIQFRAPLGSARPAGEPTNIYGRIWVPGVTQNAGADGAIRAELGLAPEDTPLQAWTFRKAGFNVQVDNDDEYLATFNLPNLPGTTLRYVYRFSKDNGVHWTYCDEDGSGSNTGLAFSLANAGAVTVTAPP